MARYTRTPLTASYQNITALNAELSKIEAAINSMLDRAGAVPNAMTSDLDLNGNNILNVANLTTAPPSSIDDNTDVDTTTTPPSDCDLFMWVDADSNWEPSNISVPLNKTSIKNLQDVGTVQTFQDGDILEYDSSTSAFVRKAAPSVNDLPNLPYQIQASDLNNILTADHSGGGITITIPEDTGAFNPRVGDIITLVSRNGDNQWAAGTNVTVVSENGLISNAAESISTALYLGSNLWHLSGSLKVS